MPYDYDVTYSFTTKADANDGSWTYWNTDKGNHSVQNRNTDQYWCWTDTGSPSSKTGPASGIACIYTETSSPTAVGDEYEMALATGLDASQYGFYVTFNICLYGQTAGHVYFSAWNGSTWAPTDDWPGETTDNGFQAKGPYDFTTYDNTDFKIKFRTYVGGTKYRNDYSVDEVRIYGDSKAAPPYPNQYNKILYTSEPPTPNAWNQVKQEVGTGWRKLEYS